MIKLVLLVFMSSLFAQDHFTSVDTTGLPYNIVITNISVDGHDPDGSLEVGVFDGDLCVGTAVFDGEFPFSVTAWKEYPNEDLPGFASGDTISFKIWTQVFGEYSEYESTAVFSYGDGTFGSGPYSIVNLTVASGLYSNIILSVEEINLGPVFVGGTASQTIQVSNDGNADLTLFSIYSSNEQFFTDFSTQEEIEVGSSLDVMISYTPNQLLPTSGMLYFESDDPGDSTKALIVYGVVNSPRILVNPASIDFGIVDMGNNTQVDLYIENIGNELLEVSSINSDNNVFNAPTESFDIVPGGLAVVTVQYMPDGLGPVNGTLSIISNDPFSPIETIDLSGYGYDSHFQPVSATGLPYSIIVNDILVDNHSLTTGDEIAVFDGELCVGTAVFDGESPFSVTTWKKYLTENDSLPGFTPGHTINFKSWATTFDTTLQVDAETEYIVGDGTFGFGTNSIVSLSVLTDLEPVIRLSDEIIDFGIQPIFGTYTYNFPIFNDGILTLEVEDINSTNSAFSVNLNSFSIPSGESQEIVLSFIPQHLNLYTGNLIVQSNDIYNSEIITPLMGQGFPAEVPNLELLTSELNLGSVIINSSATAEILIQNTGNTLLLIDNITSDNEQFEPTFNTLDIDVGEIGAIPITFTPSDIGYQTANISYLSNADEYFEINVSGYGSDDYFDVVSETGEATFFIIDSIYSQISDPIIGGEVGIFDGTTCVGVAIWDGNPLYIAAWLGDESQGLEGYTPGNPVSFYLYSSEEGENNVYNVEASFQSGDGYFTEGPTIYIDYLDVFELSTDFGCTDTEACNYASDAFIDDRGCWYSVDGCTCENGEGAELDDCGVCNGGNADQDCAGVCDGNAAEDQCGTCDTDSSNDCVQDCAGTWGGLAVKDVCDICSGDDSTCMDCNNIPNGNAYIDGCGDCVGENTGLEECDYDCAQVFGGTSVYDNCGECVPAGNTSCQQGCDELWYNSGSIPGLDLCGVCEGDNSSCSGCMDEFALYYDPDATIDDGNCFLAIDMHTIPQYYNISSIYPNPFNPITRINYGIPEYSKVEIIVYNLTGKEVKSLINEFQMPGYYQVVWNADNNPSGMYFVKLMARDFIKTQKLVLVK